MRFMNKVSDSENSQQLIDTWSELTKQNDEADASQQASTSAQAGSATAQASTSAMNQEGEWVRDFAEHKAMQGTINI